MSNQTLSVTDDSSEGVKTSSVTEDHDQQTNKGPLSFLLPLPHLDSSVPSPGKIQF